MHDKFKPDNKRQSGGLTKRWTYAMMTMLEGYIVCCS